MKFAVRHGALARMAPALFVVVAIGMSGRSTRAHEGDRDSIDWVATWAESPASTSLTSSGQTSREIVRISIGGRRPRVRLSTEMGTALLTVGAAHLAIARPGESHAFDAVIDFAAAVRDPARSTRILALFDSDVHRHPNDAGYRARADAIDLRLSDEPDRFNH